MIVTENIIINERELIRTYSDEGRYVVRDGISYSEAIDPLDSGRTYTEGEIIEVREPIEDYTVDDAVTGELDENEVQEEST